MKQRRHVVRVDTFPFLAVLLCTMGSLILILMVVDRRARVAAMARAVKEVQRLTDEDSAAAEARKLEYERRRKILHESLQQEISEVQERSVQVERKLASAESDFKSTETAKEQLHGLLVVEQSKLVRSQKELLRGSSTPWL